MTADAGLFVEQFSSLDGWVAQIEQDLMALDVEQLLVPKELQPELDWREQKLTIRVKAWQSKSLAFGRCARIDGGEQLQILNAVFFPRLSIPAPILSLEWLAFHKGLHLFVLDLLPLYPHEENESQGQSQRAESLAMNTLRSQRQRVGEHWSLGSKPEWGEQVFSDSLLLVRPGDSAMPSKKPDVSLFWGAIQAVWKAWLQQLQLEPKNDPNSLARASSLQADYVQKHAMYEPTGPYLSRLAPEDWVEQFLHQLLFPTWLTTGDEQPSWAKGKEGR